MLMFPYKTGEKKPDFVTSEVILLFIGCDFRMSALLFVVIIIFTFLKA